ncbi:MAG: hypothetical protein QM768_10025 [Agriterribacter sp.]
MKNSNVVLLSVIFSAMYLYGYCQDSSNEFKKQKYFVDSLIQQYKAMKFQEQSIIGQDEIFSTYHGNVFIDQSGIIRSIGLVFDSSNFKTTLLCLKDTIIALIENTKRFYKIKDAFYDSKGIKEISPQSICRFESYDSVLQVVKVIFKPD